MRNKFRLGAVVVFLLAVASITVASTSSSSGNSGDRGKRSVEVIRVTGIFVEESVSDLGEPGDSLGDQLAFTQDLFRRGEKVGIAGVVCTLMRLEPVGGTLHCVGTAQLPKGQITIQGLATLTGDEEGEPTQHFAITGGTGRYKTAHGVLTVVDVSETESQLTFKIIH